MACTFTNYVIYKLKGRGSEISLDSEGSPSHYLCSGVLVLLSSPSNWNGAHASIMHVNAVGHLSVNWSSRKDGGVQFLELCYLKEEPRLDKQR